jgi:hypothetical protein
MIFQRRRKGSSSAATVQDLPNARSKLPHAAGGAPFAAAGDVQCYRTLVPFKASDNRLLGIAKEKR